MFNWHSESFGRKSNGELPDATFPLIDFGK
jgi:hypothetical protein